MLNRRKGRVFFLLLMASVTVPRADTMLRVVVGGDSIALPKKVSGQNQCEPCIEPPHPGDVITVQASTDRVRRDRGAMSWILRKDLKKVYLICHGTKEFSELSYPVNYKKYEHDGPHWSIDDLLQFELSTPGTTERIQIATWPVDKFSAIVVNGLRSQFRVVVAVTTETAGNDSLVLELRKLLNELEHSGQGWSRFVPFTQGVPVLWEEAEHQPETEFVYREEAKEIGTREVPKDSYEVPSGYRRVKYDPLCAPLR